MTARAVIDRPYSERQLGFDFVEAVVDIDLFQHSVAADDPVNRKRIEELVGKNASVDAGRKFIDPSHVEAFQQFLLAAPHLGASFEDHVMEMTVLKNVVRKHAFACAEFDNGKSVELRRPLLELLGEQLSENRIQIRRRIEIAFRADWISWGGVIKAKDLFHVIPE